MNKSLKTQICESALWGGIDVLLRKSRIAIHGQNGVKNEDTRSRVELELWMYVTFENWGNEFRNYDELGRSVVNYDLCDTDWAVIHRLNSWRSPCHFQSIIYLHSMCHTICKDYLKPLRLNLKQKNKEENFYFAFSSPSRYTCLSIWPCLRY